MAQRRVMAATANAGKNSMIWNLAGIVNGLAVQGGPTSHPGLAIDSTPEDFQVRGFTYRIAGVTYFKAAQTSISFSAAHVVTANGWGAILVQINAAGTISTLIGETTQTTAMNYGSAALAIAALPAPAAGNVAVGYIVIEADAGNWTANTDDMTNGGDLDTATFTSAVDGATVDTITTHVGTPE